MDSKFERIKAPLKNVFKGAFALLSSRLAGPLGQLLSGGKHRVSAAHIVLCALFVVNAASVLVIGHRLAPLFRHGVGVGDGGQQASGVGVDGVGKNLVCGARLDRKSVV